MSGDCSPFSSPTGDGMLPPWVPELSLHRAHATSDRVSKYWARSVISELAWLPRSDCGPRCGLRVGADAAASLVLTGRGSFRPIQSSLTKAALSRPIVPKVLPAQAAGPLASKFLGSALFGVLRACCLATLRGGLEPLPSPTIPGQVSGCQGLTFGMLLCC